MLLRVRPGLGKILGLAGVLGLTGGLAAAQRPGGSPSPPYVDVNRPVAVNVSVRDSHGFPLEEPVNVRLYSSLGAFDSRTTTREGSTARFESVRAGEYQLEIKGVGFLDSTEHVSIGTFGQEVTLTVFLFREGEIYPGAPPPAPEKSDAKIRAEMEKGLEAMKRKDYAAASKSFEKAAAMAPKNPDPAFLMGVAQLAMQQQNLARAQFEKVLKEFPNYQKAMVALGEMEYQDNQMDAAAKHLEEATRAGQTDWRVAMMLATIYAKSGRLPEAEASAETAMTLAQEKGAAATLLLANVQAAEGKASEARVTYRKYLQTYPEDGGAASAKAALARLAGVPPGASPTTNGDGKVAVPPPPKPEVDPATTHPWAPPDVDSVSSAMAPGAGCNLDQVLQNAGQRLRVLLGNIEKFTATEQVQDQEVDRYGVAGSARERKFMYVAFVHTLSNGYTYVEESRIGAKESEELPISLSTTGMNGLGVSVLQPFFRPYLNFTCQGLTNINGKAAWELRFEEKLKAAEALRKWRKNGDLINIPLKGKVWISAAGYDVLRVETDLVEPVTRLELTRDHLQVNYGPVSFRNGAETLWLPQTGELYVEVHKKRYHQQHILTDYLMFAIDTPHKQKAPKQEPTEETKP